MSDNEDTSTSVEKRDIVGRFRVLVENWWMVTLAVCVGGVAALFFSVIQTPVYQATAVLYVTAGSDANSQSAYQGALASERRGASYAELVKSDLILTRALSDSRLPLTLGESRSALTAESRPDTVLLLIRAEDPDPRTAVALVDAVSSAMVTYTAELERPIDGGSPLAKLTVVSPATASDQPVSPVTWRNTILGLLLGAFVGIGFVLVRERMRDFVSNEAELSLVTDRPALSSIPASKTFLDSPVTTFHGGFSRAAEAYRRLRTNLSYVNIDSPAKTILVTSPGEGEGKTTTSLNLAAALGEAGKRVIIVDGDLRRPTVAKVLGLNPTVGLTEALRGEVSVRDLVQASSVGGFDVLASGELPPNPSELLGSERASTLLKKLATEYDFVILDSPPVLPVSDAAVLSAWCDGVLMVVRANRTRRNNIERALNELSRAHANVLGCVLNGNDVKAASYYDYYSNNGPESGMRLAETRVSAEVTSAQNRVAQDINGG